jgi:nucleotide-binding universal stress UspA family protein
MTPGGRRPRAFDQAAHIVIVVDGSEQAWRAFSWAIGYARSRGVEHVLVIAGPTMWSRLCDAGQVPGGACFVAQPSDQFALIDHLGERARELSAGSGVYAHMSPRAANSRASLIRILRAERPDVVVLDGARGMRRTGLARTVTRLVSERIPVTVIG